MRKLLVLETSSMVTVTDALVDIILFPVTDSCPDGRLGIIPNHENFITHISGK